jgi:hypothetical protein
MKKYCRKCKSEVQKIWIFGKCFYKCSNYDLQEIDILTLKEIRKEKLKTL